VFCYGFADREAVVPLRDDHIFRVFSNTKLVTSCAVMLLVEDGRIALDDPIEAYLPELAAPFQSQSGILVTVHLVDPSW